MHADLLIELGTEELPPTSLQQLADCFAQESARQLQEAGFEFASLDIFATPRRLAFRLNRILVQQPDRELERRGPAVKAAFDGDGNPTKAALGFAQSVGLTMDQLETQETDKGAWLLARVQEKGKPLAEMLSAVLEQSVQRLPIAKRMRWGSRKVQFVRPVQWLLALLDDQVLPLQLLDQTAGHSTRGHRFMSAGDIQILNAKSYEKQLETEGRVLADFNRRRELIREQAIQAGEKEGGVTAIDNDLLDEVTALVEWPVAMTGHFEEGFLRVPQEALITTMESNQKYFPVLDKNGKLKNAFVFISNLDSKEPQWVISGNEKVVRPRLADAAFFFDQDSKKTLAEHAQQLQKVVFQQQLGTVYEKTERISALAAFIAAQIGGDAALATQAGLLAKADLTSDMVYEFDTMQGVMGYYLAKHEGLPEELAQALREQYLPRFSGDDLPQTRTGIALALADKIDTLVGIFGIGQKPSGDKDPYALRRATLGILRIIIGRNLDLDLAELVAKAASLLAGKNIASSTESDVLEFIQGRYRAIYQEQGIDTSVILSVLAINISRPLDVERRIHAVNQFWKLPEAKSLAAANKRVANILAKLPGEAPDEVDGALLQEEAEKNLANIIVAAFEVSEPLLAEGNYSELLAELAGLRDTVDAFFDTVMVMADDEAVRNNRLALLAFLRDLFLQVADVSILGSA